MEQFNPLDPGSFLSSRADYWSRRQQFTLRAAKIKLALRLGVAFRGAGAV